MPSKRQQLMHDPEKTVKRMQRSFVLNVVLLIALVAGGGFYLIRLNLPARPTDVWEETRDLKTPAGRLVGHWQWTSQAQQDRVHFYFSPVDREGKGVTILQYPGGIGKRWNYQIISESRDSWKLRIQCFNGQKMVREVKLTIPDKGRTAGYKYTDNFGTTHDREMVYVGPETEPLPKP